MVACHKKLFNDFIERMFVCSCATWSIFMKNVNGARWQPWRRPSLYATWHRRKNHLQSNQSRYKYGFYDVNKCFVSENSHPHSSHSTYTMPLCAVCSCDFDCCCYFVTITLSLSLSMAKNLCLRISFRFYVPPSQAIWPFHIWFISMI